MSLPEPFLPALFLTGALRAGLSRTPAQDSRFLNQVQPPGGSGEMLAKLSMAYYSKSIQYVNSVLAQGAVHPWQNVLCVCAGTGHAFADTICPCDGTGLLLQVPARWRAA